MPYKKLMSFVNEALAAHKDVNGTIFHISKLYNYDEKEKIVREMDKKKHINE
jgi:hypothetical protein